MNFTQVSGFTSWQAGAGSTTVQPIWGIEFSNAGGSHNNQDIIFMETPTSGVISHLTLNVPTNTHTTNSTMRLRFNTTDYNSLVTVVASTTGFFEDTSNSDTVDVSEKVYLRIVQGTGGATTFETVSYLWAPTADNFTVLGSIGENRTGTNALYFSLNGISSAGTTTVAHHQLNIPYAATLRNSWVNCDSNTRTDTTTVRPSINGVIGNLICSWATNVTGAVSDTTNSDALLAGDLICWVWTPAGGSGTFRSRGQTIQVAAADKHLYTSAMFTGGIELDQNGDRYLPVGGSYSHRVNTPSVESHAQARMDNSFIWSDLWGYASAITLTGGTSTAIVRSRINGASGNQTLTWTTAGGAGEQIDSTNTDSVAIDDLLSLNVNLSKTGGSIVLRRVSSMASALPSGGPIILSIFPTTPWYPGQLNVSLVGTGFGV